MHDDRVVSFSHPEKISCHDPLTEVPRSGARQLLASAVEAEVSAFLSAYEHLVDDEGRRYVVRHGHMPAREVQIGISPVEVRRPQVRDRQGGRRRRADPLHLGPFCRPISAARARSRSGCPGST